MLTFFRWIRKSLLNSGSSGKYLLYAVGEVLLVMIGILLALQVNNWKEWRKDRLEEKRHLNSIKKELLLNKSQLDEALRVNKIARNSMKVVLRFQHR